MAAVLAHPLLGNSPLFEQYRFGVKQWVCCARESTTVKRENKPMKEIWSNLMKQLKFVLSTLVLMSTFGAAVASATPWVPKVVCGMQYSKNGEQGTTDLKYGERVKV